MVSRVGMGGIPITRPPLDEAIETINKGLDLGVNFIDTAIGYATSEARIGQAIEGRRDEVILTTKTGAKTRDQALANLDISLGNLRTDYLDIWQLHGVNTMESYNRIMGPGGAYEAALEALGDGRVKHVGFSSHTLEVALQMVPGGAFEVVQFPFNFISREASDTLLPLAKKHDVGFIGMKPFAGGMIKDADLAIKYVLQYDNVVPDPGIEKMSDITEIVGIVNGSWALSQGERDEIEEIYKSTGNRFCRQCEYCGPCPNGVIIHGLMYLQHLYELWPPERFFTWRYVLDAVKSGENCTDCGLCEPKCPYDLPIREMIKEKLSFFKKKEREHAELISTLRN
jgi:predicted aldo/keto reductase-like oxidoreductase